ncbi:Uncharacterised protein [Vibrio cholerae]|nr:Uncharacterised protein [Vibrio cholerae]CSC30779.1 Uncharacterised protein [Vibrio cholerae]CSI58060.1 Uncharacterised protein [Vibrio cholerae]
MALAFLRYVVTSPVFTLIPIGVALLVRLLTITFCDSSIGAPVVPVPIKAIELATCVLLISACQRFQWGSAQVLQVEYKSSL